MRRCVTAEFMGVWGEAARARAHTYTVTHSHTHIHTTTTTTTICTFFAPSMLTFTIVLRVRLCSVTSACSFHGRVRSSYSDRRWRIQTMHGSVCACSHGALRTSASSAMMLSQVCVCARARARACVCMTACACARAHMCVRYMCGCKCVQLCMRVGCRGECTHDAMYTLCGMHMHPIIYLSL